MPSTDTSARLTQVKGSQVVQGRAEAGRPEDRVGRDDFAIGEAHTVGGDLLEHLAGDEDAGVDAALVLRRQGQTGRRHDAPWRQARCDTLPDGLLHLAAPLQVEGASGELNWPPRHPGRRSASSVELQQELDRRCPATDHDDVLAAELVRAAEVVGVQLPPTEGLAARVVGPVRTVPGAGRTDQGRAAPRPGIRLHLERPLRAVGGGDREHVHPTADVQSEPFLEGAVVVGDHLGRRAGRIRRAQRHTGKVGNAVSGTESERRPAVSPSAARARVRVEDDEVASGNEAAAHEVVGSRKAGLPGPDDRGVDVSHDDWNGRQAEGIPATTRPGMPCRARCTA